MSKTFIYSLLVIAVYVLIIYPNLNKTTTHESESGRTHGGGGKSFEADTENGTGLSENADENGISQGASGQMKYRIGYTN